MWIALAVLGGLVIWLSLAMLAMVREQAALRRRVEELESAREPIHLNAGLPVGVREPAWEIEGMDGPISSVSFVGVRHVVVFADVDCAACGDLIPDVVAAADLPPRALIARDDVAALPRTWFGHGVLTGVERELAVTDAFRVSVSPHIFVVDQDGSIVAQGGAETVDDVRALVRGSDGIRIVAGGTDG
jgi:hypothetical protein